MHTHFGEDAGCKVAAKAKGTITYGMQSHFYSEPYVSETTRGRNQKAAKLRMTAVKLVHLSNCTCVWRYYANKPMRNTLSTRIKKEGNRRVIAETVSKRGCVARLGSVTGSEVIKENFISKCLTE